MSIGKKLMELRKSKHLSQEEAADILGVSRQTISKWELDQSTPDFDKILPLCELYEISSDELLGASYKKIESSDNTINESSDYNYDMEKAKQKKALGISTGIFLYFFAVVWIMVAIPYLRMDPILSSGIFLLLCGIATFDIVYVSIVYHKKKKEKKEEEKTNPIISSINSILAIVTLIVYFVISFTTMAWHITWILWVIYGLLTEIVKLIFLLGEANEK